MQTVFLTDTHAQTEENFTFQSMAEIETFFRAQTRSLVAAFDEKNAALSSADALIAQLRQEVEHLQSHIDDIDVASGDAFDDHCGRCREIACRRCWKVWASCRCDLPLLADVEDFGPNYVEARHVCHVCDGIDRQDSFNWCQSCEQVFAHSDCLNILGFVAGDEVEIHGLQAARELNGRRGKIVTYLVDDSRYRVDIAGATKAVRFSNLQLIFLVLRCGVSPRVLCQGCC